MHNWFVDRDAMILLPSWLEAMPQATMLRRDQVRSIPLGEPGILWYRLYEGEVLGALFSLQPLGVGQFLMVLADDPNESLVTEALAAGASGCCNTHAAPEVLRQVALVVHNGGLWIGQSLLKRLVSSTSRILSQQESEQKDEDWVSRLSQRETQVARLVAGGASNKEIAEQLFITERTVKAHLTAVFEKLALRDRLQLSLRINGVTI